MLVFGHVALNPDIGVARGQLARPTQLGVRARGRKTRRDGVTQPVLAVPLPNQGLGVDQTLLGGISPAPGRGAIQEVGGCVAVHQAQTGDQSHLTRLRRLKQRLHGGHVGGGKGQRCGHAIAQQLRYEKLSSFRTVVGRFKAFFFWKCVVFQPRQQPFGRRADDVGLGVMDVHVHKPGRNDPIGPMGHRNIGTIGLSGPGRRQRLEPPRAPWHQAPPPAGRLPHKWQRHGEEDRGQIAESRHGKLSCGRA